MLYSIEIQVSYSDIERLSRFLDSHKDESTFVYLINETRAIVVSDGELNMEYVKIEIERIFSEVNDVRTMIKDIDYL